MDGQGNSSWTQSVDTQLVSDTLLGDDGEERVNQALRRWVEGMERALGRAAPR